MKAILLTEYGSNDVLKVSEVPMPKPGKGQILIEVAASSINPFDLFLRSGAMKEKAPLQLPFILGSDTCGTITELGENVTAYTIGDVVYGQALAFTEASGAWAEYATVNTANIARAPKILSAEENGSLPLAGASAVQALIEHIQLKKGQKILIHGGAGGIGSLAIQLAKAIGAEVATTVHTNDVAFVKTLGADIVINVDIEQFTEIIHGYDIVFDTVGGEVLESSCAILKRGGILVSMKGKPTDEHIQKYGIQAIGQYTQVTTDHLNILTEYVEAGKIRPIVDSAFPLEQIKQAAEKLETGKPKGKVVLKIKK